MNNEQNTQQPAEEKQPVNAYFGRKCFRTGR